MEQQFIVSARKYRPESFETVVGQPSITRTLKNAIAGNHLAHAYLFCGPRGVGKTTCARIFAKTINCSHLNEEMEACGECEACKTFQESRSFNIHELDAASNNHVEDIRNLIDQVRIPPQTGNYSVYIIDEVHMLSQAAFNAFLKTLEEPPAHAIFILATTEKHKILPTILSRCQVFDFHRIQIHDIIGQLQRIAQKEGITAEVAALNVIAHKADGAMRDALSIFDQVVSFSGNSITYQKVIDHLNVLDLDYYFKLTDLFLAGNYRDSLILFNKILEEGFDGHNFIAGLSSHFRDLLVSKDQETIELLEVGEEMEQKYRQTAAQCSVEFLFEALKILNACDLAYKQAKDQRLLVEINLLSLSRILSKPRIQEAPKASEPMAQPKPAPPQTSVPVAEPQPARVPAPAPEVVQEKMVKAEKVQPTVAAPVTRISDYIKKKPVDEPVATEEKPEKQEVQEGPAITLTPASLKAIWMEFAETLKADQPRLYNTLITQLPELTSDSRILLHLNNPLQEKAIRSIQFELNDYIQKKTGRPDIKIETEVPDQPAERKLYTQQEKYNHLQQKNPNLDLFRQSLDLDLE
jgi:DNA polymerase-3 subunit gamma/tau